MWAGETCSALEPVKLSPGHEGSGGRWVAGRPPALPGSVAAEAGAVWRQLGLCLFGLLQVAFAPVSLQP